MKILVLSLVLVRFGWSRALARGFPGESGEFAGLSATANDGDGHDAETADDLSPEEAAELWAAISRILAATDVSAEANAARMIRNLSPQASQTAARWLVEVMQESRVENRLINAYGMLCVLPRGGLTATSHPGREAAIPELVSLMGNSGLPSRNRDLAAKVLLSWLEQWRTLPPTLDLTSFVTVLRRVLESGVNPDLRASALRIIRTVGRPVRRKDERIVELVRDIHLGTKDSNMRNLAAAALEVLTQPDP